MKSWDRLIGALKKLPGIGPKQAQRLALHFMRASSDEVESLLGAVREAGRYGLYDLDRLERMILRRVTREYFLLEGESDDD